MSVPNVSPAAAQLPILPEMTQVKGNKIVHNGKTYTVHLHYNGKSTQLTEASQLERIKRILEETELKTKNLTKVTIENGEVLKYNKKANVKRPPKLFRTVAGKVDPSGTNQSASPQAKKLETIKTLWNEIIRAANISVAKTAPVQSQAPNTDNSPQPLAENAKTAIRKKKTKIKKEDKTADTKPAAPEAKPAAPEAKPAAIAINAPQAKAASTLSYKDSEDESNSDNPPPSDNEARTSSSDSSENDDYNEDDKVDAQAKRTSSTSSQTPLLSIKNVEPGDGDDDDDDALDNIDDNVIANLEDGVVAEFELVNDEQEKEPI